MEIERVVAEWLVLKCCSTWGTAGFPQVFVRCDANDVCLERPLVTCLKARAHGD